MAFLFMANLRKEMLEGVGNATPETNITFRCELLPEIIQLPEEHGKTSISRVRVGTLMQRVAYLQPHIFREFSIRL
jgi:hypothetical protein